MRNLSLVNMISRRFVMFFVLLNLCALSSANAQDRHALVVGNSNYGSGFDLVNPRNDATAIAEKLNTIGYKVHKGGALYDLNLEAFDNEIEGFLSGIDNGASVLVYYAGHGSASGNSNYLIPILPRGVKLRTDSDIRDRSISIESILERVENSNPTGVNVFFIDACRDAPVSNTRSINLTGLTALDSRRQPRGSFIGFSTEYGRVAEDGVGSEYSPFAAAVLNNLDKKAGAPIELFYKGVSEEVYRTTNGKQYPIQEPKIRGEYCIVKCYTQSILEQPQPQPQPQPSNSNQEIAIKQEPKSNSTALKIVGGVAAVLLTGLLLSKSDSGSGDGYQITLVPPTQ